MTSVQKTGTVLARGKRKRGCLLLDSATTHIFVHRLFGLISGQERACLRYLNSAIGSFTRVARSSGYHWQGWKGITMGRRAVPLTAEGRVQVQAQAQAQALPPGVPGVYAPHRGQCPGAARYPPDLRQLRHPQACPRRGVAGALTPLSSALHAHLQFVAKSSRALVRIAYQPGDPSRLLRFGRGSQAEIDALVKQYNQHTQPLRWTATSESILRRPERLSKVINGTQH